MEDECRHVVPELDPEGVGGAHYEKFDVQALATRALLACYRLAGIE